MTALRRRGAAIREQAEALLPLTADGGEVGELARAEVLALEERMEEIVALARELEAEAILRRRAAKHGWGEK